MRLAGPVLTWFSRVRSFCPSVAKLRSGRLRRSLTKDDGTVPAPCRHAPLPAYRQVGNPSQATR